MALRILHTADWHFGKRLYQRELTDDHLQFLTWLKETIITHQITHVLVSGDVFDLANPSAGALQVYYRFLKEIIALRCTFIITGGNHDSPAVLNAPADILKLLDIIIVGGAKEQLADMLIPLHNAHGEIEAVVAAIPYLRDRDIRTAQLGESYADRIIATREGLAQYYAQMGEHAQSAYPEVPAIAMGHLFVQGATTSESEREIQVGNLADVGADIFPNHFKYVALGHIHKPQDITSDGRVRYSGSPIPLSFSEAGQTKRCIIISVAHGQIQQEIVEIPAFRAMYRWKGSLEKLKQLANELPPEVNPPYVEAVMEIPVYDTVILREKDEWLTQIREEGKIEILDIKIQLLTEDAEEKEAEQAIQHISEVRPLDFFTPLLHEHISEEDRNLLLLAFQELVTEAEHTGTDEN